VVTLKLVRNKPEYLSVHFGNGGITVICYKNFYYATGIRIEVGGTAHIKVTEVRKVGKAKRSRTARRS